jgi:Hemerythrin HHE cation binding domain
MDAITLIEKQHVEVDELFEQLENAKGGDQEKRSIFAKLADSLAAHMAMEEQVFYPAIKERKLQDVLLEALEEHLAIRRVLADLMDTPPSDPRWAAKLAVCKEQTAHHAHEEEEKDLLPVVRKALSDEELEELGDQMLAFYEQQMSTGPRRHLPQELDQAAAL